jgi:hypothetical protein
VVAETAAAIVVAVTIYSYIQKFTGLSS